MQKAMTADEVSGNFASASKVNAGGSLTESGSIDTQAFLSQIQKDNMANANASGVRNGKPKTFDDAKDHGSVPVQAGMTPLSINPPVKS